MESRRALEISAIAALALSVTGCSVSKASDAKAHQASAVDREIHLSIYAGRFGQVHESRQFDLNEGRNRINLPLISKRIDSQSLVFDSTPDGPSVVSTTSDLGMSSQESIVKRLAGTEVEVVLTGNDGKMGEHLKGTLESRDGSGFVLRTPEKTYVNPPGMIVVDGSSSLSTMQGMNAEVQSKQSGKKPVGFSYLSAGLGWSADYIVRLEKASDKVEFEGWATIQNETSVAYPDAKISLIAGAPNQTVREDLMLAEAKTPSKGGFSGDGDLRMAMRRRADKSEAQGIDNHGVPLMVPVGDLQSIEVPARATILPDQLNRVRLVDSHEVPVKKDYIATIGYPWGGTKQHIPLEAHMTFKNDKLSGLGFPLASGSVRVLDHGTFVGSAVISDTPKDEKVELTIGTAFDVNADMVTLSAARVDKRHWRADVEVTFHNHRALESMITVCVGLGQGGLVLSGPAPKPYSGPVKEIELHVPANSDKKIRLRLVTP